MHTFLPAFLGWLFAVHIVCDLPLWTVCGSGSVLPFACAEGSPMNFCTILDQVIDVLRQRQRVTYRALKRQFNVDDDYLEDVKAELIQGQRLAVDEEGVVLVWTGEPGTMATAAAPTETAAQAPLAYTPVYLAEKIITVRPTLEGERKQ